MCRSIDLAESNRFTDERKSSLRMLMVSTQAILTRGTVKLLEFMRKWFGALFSGAYLILLYVLAIWLSVGSLSAIQVREALEGGDQPATFSEVQRELERFDMEREIILATLDSGKVTSPQPNITEAAGIKIDSTSNNGNIDIDFLKERQRAYADIETLRDGIVLSKYFDLYRFFQFAPYYTSFLHEPREILVLQLTIAMGILGSVVAMTWSFVNHESDIWGRRFVMLPLVGSMSAFIVLVFLKAGQLSLTAGEANDSLNPFVLSFVGIISGLLSERAYAKIAEVGGNLFQVGEKLRYGIHLQQQMDEHGRSIQELSKYLDNIRVPVVEEIIAGNKEATPTQQQVIAAYLRKDIRDIFNELPNKSTSGQGS
jgi:hypothetical protein